MHAHIKQMRLRVPDLDQVARAQWAIEEAIRLSGRDGGQRLVLIRKLDVGRLGQGFNVRVDAQLRALIEAAKPGDDPASADATAIYFETPEAARVALLDLVLRGAEPAAWYWQQAVPEWRRGDASAPFAVIGALTRSAPGRIALSRLVVELLSRRREARLAALVTPESARALLDVWPGPAIFKPHEASAADAAMPGPPVPMALRLRISGIVATASAWDARLLWWAAAILPAFVPHVSDNAAAAIAITRQIELRPLPPGSAPVRFEAAHGNLATGSVAARSEAKGHAEVHDLPNTPSSAERPETETNDLPSPTSLTEEERSRAAGLFLLIRPLRFLGFERWLDAHPQAAMANHGIALLRSIAERQRVSESDPVWRFLSLPEGTQSDTTPWRIALDRLLRRRCRLKLAAVVKRPGWLSGGAATLSVRFPLDDADPRLRRHGFDIDPGFVPWLARHLAYRFEDR